MGFRPWQPRIFTFYMFQIYINYYSWTMFREPIVDNYNTQGAEVQLL